MGVKVARTSVGNGVHVGGGVSVGDIAGEGVNEEQEIRRKRKVTCTARTPALAVGARECRWEKRAREITD